MSDQLKQIAARIKGLREIEGVSAESLAREFHVALETYLAYESGDADIPVGVPHLLAAKFGIELTALLTGDEPRLHTYDLTRKGRGVTVDRRNEYSYQALALNFIHKKADPFLVTVDPEPEGTPIARNAHPGQEFDYVLRGSLKMVVGRHEIVLNEGDALFFDSSCEHGLRALNNEQAQFLAVVM